MMISLYVSSDCASCIKVKKWLDEQGLPYCEQNIHQDPLTKEDIKEMSTFTTQGVQEIISCHSSTYIHFKNKIIDASLDELMDLLIDHPNLIRCPLIMDNQRLQIGYSEEDISFFLPRKIHKFRFVQLSRKIMQVKSALKNII